MAQPQSIGRWISENTGYLGAVLAYIVAGIHLFHPKHGFPRLVTLITTGNMPVLVYDPRPVVFVFSALAILLGIKLVLEDVAQKHVYALGVLLVATYFVGYFAWHLSGHGGFLPGRKPLYHGLGPAEAVIAHLLTSPLAALSKLAETVLIAVLAALYRGES